MSDEKQKLIDKYAKTIVDNEIFCYGNELLELYQKANDFYQENIINIENYDYEEREYFEVFIVSNWLADKLEEKNELLVFTDHHKLWLRRQFGSLVYTDKVFQELGEMTYNHLH